MDLQLVPQLGWGLAFTTFLIVDFALHNTTEGIAIAAPMSKEKLMIGKLAAMGMIAGTPTIFGACIGALYIHHLRL